ncbi:MAG: fibronectin type III domain-containing protein [Bacteroidales bacterium]
MKKSLLVILTPFLLFTIEKESIAQHHHYHEPQYSESWSKPGHHPDHIVLNLTENPSSSMSVTWRTDTTVNKGIAEIAIATPAPKFWRFAEVYSAKTETLDATNILYAGSIANYHSVTFQGLEPDTMYAYRVGDGEHWSEWFQFRTAPDKEKPFSFLYVGDAQNNILDLWARLIREGYRKAPDAGFILHAGDLVNHAHSEQEWHEWFKAGGFIHSMVPSISTPGNHEMQSRTEEERAQNIRSLSVQWRPQFTLPMNGVEGLEETVYYVDYNNTRIISLNSNQDPNNQTSWLEEVLKNNPMKWTLVTYHHPLYSASARRDNPWLRDAWKPIFDKYAVDLVLQGHDHSYARGKTNPPEENIVSGINKRDYAGTVYVVSVSGAKMYKLEPTGWDAFEGVEQDRNAENTQLFQVISIDGDRLSYESYTATGELYDAFDLVKSGENKPNQFIERKDEAIPARYHNNTIPYDDFLPESVEKKILEENEGFEINRISAFNENGQQGYNVRLYKGDTRLDLKIDMEGKVLEREIRE